VWVTNRTDNQAVRTLHVEVETPDETHERESVLLLPPQQNTKQQIEFEIGPEAGELDMDALEHRAWLTETGSESN
jgi:hypothetical protein